MSSNAEGLLVWLKRQRRINELEMNLMAVAFDLDGAMDSGQPELAWRAIREMIEVGLELYARKCSVLFAEDADSLEQVFLVLDALARLDPRLTEEAWSLLLRPFPGGAGALADAVHHSRTFLHGRLRLPLSREEAVRDWADGVKLLRDVASGFGLAQSDSWYLKAGTTAAEQLSWYDDVMNSLAVPSERPL